MLSIAIILKKITKLQFLLKGELEEDITKRELIKLKDEARYFKLGNLDMDITARLLKLQKGTCNYVEI